MTPTPTLAFITIVATLAYLGLAILGWGGFAAFFSHPALIALAIALFVLSGVALFSGGNVSPGEREDADRAAGRLSTGLHRPVWVLDPRRRCHSLAWRRSLRRPSWKFFRVSNGRIQPIDPSARNPMNLWAEM